MNRTDWSRTPEKLATLLIDRRRVVIAIVLTLVLATSAGVVFLEAESGFGDVSLGTDEEADLAYIEANFSSTAGDREVAQVVAHGDNVLEKETLIETLELQQQIERNESVEPTLADGHGTTGIATVLATAAIQQRFGDEREPTLEEQITVLEQLDQQELDMLIEQFLGEEDSSTEASVFLPNEYEPGSTTASATMLVVFQSVEEEYPGAAAPEHIVESHLAIQTLGEESDLDTTVIGNGILTDEEERALEDTMALIGPLALLLVVFVLALAYRDLADVMLGLTGIVLVQLWTFGTLGWLGIDFNPILVAVPVLLIGLSIDYCLHVFMRYRENQDGNGGSENRYETATTPSGIDGAMSTGLAGVGVALLWVTVTTSIGFLSNLVSPIGPIRELGVVAAVGIIGSFVIFVLLVPPVKVELDTQLERLGVDRQKTPIGTEKSKTGTFLQAGATAARKAPIAVLLVVLVITALATVAAADVSTSWGPEENMVDDPPVVDTTAPCTVPAR